MTLLQCKEVCVSLQLVQLVFHFLTNQASLLCKIQLLNFTIMGPMIVCSNISLLSGTYFQVHMYYVAKYTLCMYDYNIT